MDPVLATLSIGIKEMVMQIEHTKVQIRTVDSSPLEALRLLTVSANRLYRIRLSLPPPAGLQVRAELDSIRFLVRPLCCSIGFQADDK